MNSTKPNLTICNRCILPVTFPGIKFDENGICNHCNRDKSTESEKASRKSDYQERLDNLIGDTRGSAPTYDAIMAYSGGKDSSYTLKILREKYDLRILAFTFDNHFVSPFAWKNIEKMTDVLGGDLIRFRPPWLDMKRLFSLCGKEDIFSKPTLLRASSVCTACIGLVKSLVLKTALEMSIPLVAFGWSPGQAPIQSAIMKTNSTLTRQNQSAFKKAFPPDLIRAMEQYLIPESYYKTLKDRFPLNIHPLAFFDYDERNIISELAGLGWETPSDTDTNSSNCLLNAFANHRHLERHKFHPYVWEIANMVRQGVMGRNEGIEKIYTDQNEQMVEYARKKLEA